MGELSDELDQIAAELQRLVAGTSAGMPLWAVSFWGVVVAVVAFVVGGGVDFKIGGSPKWTEVVTAVVSVVLLTTVLISAYQLRLGLTQLRRTRGTDQARWAINTYREWDETLLPVRVKVASSGNTPHELRTHIRRLWLAKHADYYDLLREPAYWDRVAYLVKSAELSPAALDLLTGPDAAFRWSLWEPAIGFLRSDECGLSNAFDQFEWLAQKISAEQLWEYHRKPGEPDDEYLGPR